VSMSAVEASLVGSVGGSDGQFWPGIFSSGLLDVFLKIQPHKPSFLCYGNPRQGSVGILGDVF